MQTVRPGASGLAVTPVACGTWQYGADRGPMAKPAALQPIEYARPLGANFFDTARAYGSGGSEWPLGVAAADELGSARESVVIAAKGDLRRDGDRLVHDVGPAWLHKGVEAGAAALAELVAQGLLPHLRVSDCTLGRMADFATVLPVATVQPPHRLFRRDIESDLPGCPAVQVAIVDGRTPAHLAQSLGARHRHLSRSDLAETDHITTATIPFGDPILEAMS
ncbi:aldo/keto reductase [Streptomyces barringtoniae]|uniref:aldo/keto reductase n=1 Tax=Streptomyces barringtoniae TaxID=2892029 RepID=UPI001E364D29|nr:aldo/keto reductase [Streptomyces barringtoniae]MCC5480895.1 aldo/keto reductase [Streptomyces barringtoniae]